MYVFNTCSFSTHYYYLIYAILYHFVKTWIFVFFVLLHLAGEFWFDCLLIVLVFCNLLWQVWSREHLRVLKNQKEVNPFYKHKLNEHPNENAVFKMKVNQSFKDPLTRFANEGVRINCRKQWLHSKSEFHQPNVVRLQVEQKQNLQEEKHPCLTKW